MLDEPLLFWLSVEVRCLDIAFLGLNAETTCCRYEET